MNTTYDKILAVISLALFFAFCGVISIWVMEWDLKVALLIGVAMASYDFWLDAFKGGTNGNGTPTKKLDPSAQKDSI
ncbi:MAG: hypothetical protein AAFR75_12225 [Pseudomonadota bacterium]